MMKVDSEASDVVEAYLAGVDLSLTTGQIANDLKDIPAGKLGRLLKRLVKKGKVRVERYGPVETYSKP